MGKMSRYGNELYQGRRSFDFVGRRGVWYVVTLVVVAVAGLGVIVKPLNFGVEFVGGVEYKITVGSGNAGQDAADELRDAVGDAGIEAVGTPQVTTSGDDSLTMQTDELSADEIDQVREVVLETFPDIDAGDVSQQDVGPSWGKQVAQRAGIGVAVFLVLVVLFIWGYFREWKMSVAALLALLHDIVITVGVYAWSGFQVTPSAVTGLLAILGFSLYDTVVVFDKVRENTTTLRKSGQSYADAANLAVNQTLVRSINTSIVALIPIGAILYVSTVQLGASSLQDLALSQFVGMAAGVYSSVVLAPRFLVHMKSNETDIKEQERRAKAKAKQQAADRYAAVPAAADEGAPVRDGAPELEEIDDDDSFRVDVDDDPADEPASERGRPVALGKGRTPPRETRKVEQSGASGRQQPTRKPRSQRGKP